MVIQGAVHRVYKVVSRSSFGVIRRHKNEHFAQNILHTIVSIVFEHSNRCPGTNYVTLVSLVFEINAQVVILNKHRTVGSE